MSKPINRRAMLRYSALAGAGALTSPLWAGAADVSAAIARPTRPAGPRCRRGPGGRPHRRLGAAAALPGPGASRSPGSARVGDGSYRLHPGVRRRHRRLQPGRRRARHRAARAVLHRRDPPAQPRGPAPGGRRDDPVQPGPQRLPAGGVHPVAGHRADELLAAHLLLRPAQHRDHRAGHAERPGRRQPLVELEEPRDPRLRPCSRRWPTTTSRSRSGYSARALPAAADDPAVPHRHRAASRASPSSTRRSGT